MVAVMCLLLHILAFNAPMKKNLDGSCKQS